MEKTFITTTLVCFCCLFFYSFSQIGIPTKEKIKADTELEKGDLLYEDSLAIIYIDRKTALEVLKDRFNYKFLTNCDKNRLTGYIENIEKGNVFIFAPVPEFFFGEAFFEEKYRIEILDLLLLNCRFSVLNKSTGVYEKYLIRRIDPMRGHGSAVDLEFPNGNRFMIIRIATDIVIRENCD